MKENKCVCCDAILPEGRQVCAKCLSSVDVPPIHSAARTLIDFCREQRSRTGVCPEDCPFRHHCENKISRWDKLSLRTMIDKEEQRGDKKEMIKKFIAKAQEQKQASKNWIHNHTFAVYGIIIGVFSVLVFLLGVLVGTGIDNLNNKTPSQDSLVTEQSVTDLSVEPTWFIPEGEL